MLVQDLILVGRWVLGEPKRVKKSARSLRIARVQAQRLRKRRRHYLRWGVALAALTLARPAYAQQPGVVTPFDLFDPESGDGVKLGEKLHLYPRLEVDGTFDNNIYNTENNEIDDFVLSVRPRFLLKPDLGRHSLQVYGGAEFQRHADVTSEDSDQYDIGGRAVLDFASRTELAIDGGYRHGIEQRGTAGDQFLTDRPIEYDRVEFGAQLRRTGGFLEMLGEVRLAEIDFEDATQGGVPVDLSGRDVSVQRARIRGSAPSSDHTRIFLEVSGNRVRYERDDPISRDSDGFAVIAGMRLLLTDLIQLEAGGGYIHQEFDNPAIENVSDINYHLRIDWTPKPDVEVTALAQRVVEPSPRTDVPAIVATDFRLEATKVFGDRLLATAEVGARREEYQGINRSDLRLHAGLSAHYRLTNNVGVVGRVGWRQQDGGDFGRDYSGVSATVGVRIRM